jgi:hypothetical protein
MNSFLNFIDTIILLGLSPFINAVYVLPSLLSTYRNDWFPYMKVMKNHCKYNQKLHKNSHPLYVDKKVLYLFNHRDVSDFFIDSYTTRGDAAYLSRWAVAIVFPLLYIATSIYGSVFYFKRASNIDKDKFNNWLYNSLKSSSYNGLIIYPEGTRRHSTEITTLKSGSFHFAYKYNIPIQIIINKNKEFVLSLKKCSAQKNVNLYMYRSEVIFPDQYDTVDKFIEKSRMIWEESWNKVYSESFSVDDYVDYEQQSITHVQPLKRIILWNIYAILEVSVILFAYPFNLILLYYVYKTNNFL